MAVRNGHVAAGGKRVCVVVDRPGLWNGVVCKQANAMIKVQSGNIGQKIRKDRWIDNFLEFPKYDSVDSLVNSSKNVGQVFVTSSQEANLLLDLRSKRCYMRSRGYNLIG